jgi:hypothetical protein
MRSRKAKGKKPAVVTMTEGEIVDACLKYLADKGIVTGDTCWLKIDTTKEPKRRGRRIEFSSAVRDTIVKGQS